jgi:cell division protein FtsW
MLLIAIVMLILVLVPGIGRMSNGARRWFPIGPLRFQPSEFAKFAVIMYLAAALSGQKFRIRSFGSGLLVHLLFVGVVAGLVLIEPDMGTASLVVINAGIMFFVAGALKRHLVSLAASGVLAGGVLIAIDPERLSRLTTFINPMKDYYGNGYQVMHSLVALGSGGLLGVGLCEGREKFYLPAAQTDFIFATLGEEAGLLGALVVVGLFLLIAYRGLSIASRAKSPYYSILAVGLTSMICVQAIINICVVSSSMPATGVPLPFLSYGGSALMFALMAAGLLLNISRHAYSAAEVSLEDTDEGYPNRGRDGRTHLSRSQHSRRNTVRRPQGRSPIRR